MAERDQDGKGRAIQKWRPGRRIPTLLQAEREDAAPPRLEIDPALWREVFLVQDDEANGGVLTMALLRPLSWLESQGVELGAWVAIDLPEMGVQGKALVTAVQPCPEIEEGEGRLVTGTFRRSKAMVLELKVSGEPDVLGVTGNHLVWSEDRQDWVAVKDLDIGERLRAWDGSTPEVESLTACSAPEPVYNIEVEGDHCYRVGQQGLLVHNASVPCVRQGLDWNKPNLKDRWYVKTVQKLVPPHGAGRTLIPETVVSLAVAWIKKSDIRPTRTSPPDTDAQTWVQKFVGIYEYDKVNNPRERIDYAGHIIADTLGGHGVLLEQPLNIFPINPAVNASGSLWYAGEKKVRDELAPDDACGKMVCVQVMLTYPDQNDRPWSLYPARPKYLNYAVWVDGSRQYNATNVLNPL